MKAHKKNEKKEEFYQFDKRVIGYGLLALIVVLIIAGLFYYDVIELPGKKEGKGEEKVLENFTIPVGAPEVELYVISNAECKECLNVSKVVEIIRGAPTLKVVSDKAVAHDSDEGKELIGKYDLKRLPAFVLKIVSDEKFGGDIPPFEKRNDNLVYDKTPPPYYDVAEGKVKGIVSVTKVIDPDCKDCFDIELLAKNLKLFGLAVGDEKTVAYDTQEGKDLIEKYGIKKIPTLVFSGDAAEYEQISGVWEDIGTTEEDGMMVLRKVNPPYHDLEAGSVKGVVEITHLKDSGCEKCFDTAVFKSMFEQQLAMKFSGEKSVDVSSAEGKQLVEDLGIKFVPTVILSGDAGEYPGIASVWDQIGKVVDGKYVLTKLDAVPNLVYKDLEKNEVVGLKEEKAEDGGEVNETA